MKTNCQYSKNQFILLLIFLLICVECNNKSSPNICQKILASLKAENSQQVKKLISKLQQLTSQSCLLELSPRYYWAQNMTHIFVKFQFLNSVDTSACDRVLSIKKNVEHNKIEVSLICTQSNFILRYKISVVTFMPLNYYHAVWLEGEQNTIILECIKSPNPYFWKKLYLDKKVPIRKPKVWWAIVEKYLQNTKKFIYDLQVQQQEFDISQSVRKKKKSRLPKDAKQLDPFSKKYLYCNQDNPFQLGSWIT